MHRVAAALALALAGCSHPASPSADAGAPAEPRTAAPSASTEPSPVVEAPPILPTITPLDEPAPSVARTVAPVFGEPPPAAEARRTTLARLADDRVLAAHEAVIREHFGGELPSPIEAQSAPLLGDRRAVLLYGPARDCKPLILVLDPRGALLWTKERPLAGTRQVVTEMVLAPGPRGEVALLWCDIPTQVVALRKWGWDGTVLADFQVAEVELCEALAGLYWPGRGWIAVASQHGAARAQLLDERGKRAFGPGGAELPWHARPSAPAAIAVDGEASAMIFQVGDLERAGGAGALDHLLGTRVDTLGTPLWERPLDLGAAPPGASGARPQIVRGSAGTIRASLGKGLTANVTSAGSILAR